MKVLLIVPFTKTVYGPPNTPRLGIAYLSASLKKNKIDHDVLDLSLYTEWRKKLKSVIKKYLIFGITSTTYEFKNASEIAKYIKRFRHDSKILLGGPHATLMGREILKNHKEIDFCCRGEGEECFPKLIKLLKCGRKIEIGKVKNLYFREKGTIGCSGLTLIENIDQIPFPDYQKFELNKYSAFPLTVGILTSRGCPFRCIFCSVGMIMGKSFRARSPKNVVEEMEILIKNYGTKKFIIHDDNFSLDISRAKEICKEIINRNLKICWYLSNGVRADRLNEELLDLMKKSGCREIAIGIENVNNRVLKKLNKGETIEDIKKAISLIQKYQIPIKGFFLIGAPGETINDARNNLKFALDKKLEVARFGMLIPYPGTDLWNWVEKNNYWTVSDPVKAVTEHTDIGRARALYSTPSFSKKEKERAYGEIWHKWEDYAAGKSIRMRIFRVLKKLKARYR